MLFDCVYELFFCYACFAAPYSSWFECWLYVVGEEVYELFVCVEVAEEVFVVFCGYFYSWYDGYSYVFCCYASCYSVVVCYGYCYSCLFVELFYFAYWCCTVVAVAGVYVHVTRKELLHRSILV